jgi:phage tail sheath protein FI
MAYQLSPGVRWSEIDLTTIIPSVSTTEGAFVGDFAWGPINEVFAVGSELELVRYFHRPTADTFKSWFTAANYLSYAESLKLVRVANTNVSRNATSGAQAILITNDDDYTTNYADLSAGLNYGMFAAKYAGALGNSIKVSMFADSSNLASYGTWEYYLEFDAIPGTSNWVGSRGGANDEMHVIVIDSLGSITGIANTVLEKFSFVSKASDAKTDDGSSNYYLNVLNDRSEFIRVLNHGLSGSNTDTSTWGSVSPGVSFTQNTASYTSTLSGGVLSLATDADIALGYDLFKDPEEWDISLIMTGAHSQTVAEHVIENVAGGTSANPDTGRRDCVVFVSPDMSDVVDNAGSEANDIVTKRNLFNSSSYVVFDSGWKKQFDKYNNVYRWIPLNADIAGLCARTDFERDPWFSPAGLNRGHIKNVVKLSWNPGKDDRDTLYKNGINPVVNFRGEGVVLYGDKTMLTKPSAFDRINVRRLFIVLEKAISKAAKYSLFEFNDEFTRAQFVALVEPYLRDVKGRRGIYDFRVVCDETNNTPEVIDRNEFVGDIYIKPARSINFIQLNFVAVRTGVAFSEVVGRF